MRRRHERAHLGRRVIRRADLERRDSRSHAFDAGDPRHHRQPRPQPKSPCNARPPSRRPRRPAPRRSGPVRIRHDHHVVLGAAEGLHALARRGAVQVDAPGDRRGADETDRRDVRMFQQRIDRRLVAVDDVEDAVRQARLVQQFREAHRRRRIALGGLQHEGVAAGERHREHPHRHHDREIERRDARRDAQRLAQAEHVDAGADVVAEFPLQQVRCTAGELDDFEAAGHFAARITDGLAVLARQQARQLVGVLLDQFLEARQDARAAQRRGCRPGRERRGRGAHRGIDIGALGERHAGDHAAGSRVEDLGRAGCRG